MIPGSANPLLLASAAAAPAGYAISRSLRFNSADSAYLSRTPASAGNRKTWTWAGWVKRSLIDSSFGRGIFGCDFTSTSDSTFFDVRFGTSAYPNSLAIGGYYTNWRITSQVFRDASAWYHICVAVDTTQATGVNRIKLYVNGAQVTSFATSSDPSLNADLGINNTTAHNISRGFYDYFSGYLADIHFIDGQALDPTSFGEFDTNGIWQPKAYTGTYPGNSFHLTFSDNSTAGSLGDDSSGNGNNWTVNNISVAAGAGNDSLVDVPLNGTETDTGLGGEVRGNYCTLNPLDNGGVTLSNGNLEQTYASAAFLSVRGTIGVASGKLYWEGAFTAGGTPNATGIGFALSTASLTSFAGQTGSWGYLQGGVTRANGGSSVSYGASYTTGDVIGIALDLDAGTCTFYKNGVSQGQAFSGLSGTFFPFSDSYDNSKWILNFGQRPFAYPVSGFKSLCTANLPAPVITKPSEYMDVALYTGNGGTQTISGLEFSPDLVWIKNRAQVDNHKLLDTVRGATEELESNTTDAEVTNADGLTAFNSDGFDLGADVEYNTSTEAYVAWTWDAGSSTVTNTDGSITSSVRANPSAGFSIVSWVSDGSAAGTIGHGLNVNPSIILYKLRSTSSQWYLWTNAIDGSEDYLLLNTTDAKVDVDTGLYGTPTSTTISNFGWITSSEVIAYCFAPVAGYSSFGSYTGNGSADGPFIFCNFRPRWIMVKASSISNGWYVFDTARDAYNAAAARLVPNTSAQESTSQPHFDLLSNGFKLRGSDSAWNGSGSTYIYFAVAEHPFQYARAR